jgi:hypothetical protein
MGTQAAPFLFLPPLLVGVVLLLLFIFRERRHSDQPEQSFRLGRDRLAKGYLGALVVLSILSLWAALAQHLTDLAFLYFIAFAVLLMFLLTVIVLPMLPLLGQLGFASVIGVASGSTVPALVIGALLHYPLVPSALVGVVLSAAFSLAAGWPLLRSSRLVA